MTGHIRERGKGTFLIKFDIARDPKTGKRRYKYATVKGSRKDAKLELARLVAQHADGDFVDPSKITVSQFLDRWEREWAKINTSPKTFERYNELLRLHVRPRIGSIILQKLKAADLSSLYADLVRSNENLDGLAPRTVGHVHRVIHRALGHAVQWSEIRSNPATVVSPPRVEETEIEILSADGVKKVLDQMEGRALYIVGFTMLATGMRRGEVCGLQWRDVDFDAGHLRVERSVEQVGKTLRLKSPKTKHGRRKITVGRNVLTALRAHWADQQAKRLRLGMGKAGPEDFVFATRQGQMRAPDPLTNEWKAEMKRISIAASLHSLRHTHASHLISKGIDVLTISRRLGHSSPTVTLTVYGHLFASTDQEAARVMDATFATSALDG